jgi:hypothetical protein
LPASYPTSDRKNAVDRDKGSYQMNLRTSLIAIGAILALIAPVAASARAIVNQKGDTYLSFKHSGHAVVNSTSFVSENGHRLSGKLNAGNARVARPDVIYTAPFGASPIVTPGYIYSPGAISPSAYVDPNECADTGGNCTDVELCTYWGENCDIVAAVPQDAATPGQTR